MRRALLMVTLVTALCAPAAVAWADEQLALTAPLADSILTGVVTVTAAAPDAATSVAFDRSLDNGTSWSWIATDTDGSNGWTTTWMTAPLDGPAILRATAGADHVIVAVTLRNRPAISLTRDPTRFSPNGDGTLDSTRLSVRTDEPARVALSIVDSAGRTRRRWSFDAAIPGTFWKSWNGRNASGTRLTDGRYAVRTTVTDLAGNASTATSAVTIDTIAPRIVWSGVSPDPSSGSVTQRFTFSVRDVDVRFSGTMRVRNTTREIAARRVSLDTRKPTLSWKPSWTLYPGTYRTSVRLADRAGNRSRAAVRPWRVHRSMVAHVHHRFVEVGRTVALTFDDCYDSDAWRSILDTLRSRNVKASFFCPGETLAPHPELPRRTVAAGHSIGGHGWDHANLTGRSDWFIRSRLLADRDAWWKYGRATCAPYFRPPYGALDARVIRIAGEAAMPRVMMWSVDPRDWARPGVSIVVNRVLSGARPGSIILLHTIGPTARALPAILDGLKSRSLRPLSLDQMFAL
jgi:peptidoglycan/xylan/chitin deacetylase (PgdA/CDA1 family)